jgi:hypothetical protein
LLITCSVLATTALATTYVRVEKDGTKTYSDRPLPGGHPVEIQPAQTYSSPAPSGPSVLDSRRPREELELQEAANFRYTLCQLSPRNDETFTNPSKVDVNLTLSPPLRAGDELRILVDGVAPPSAAGVLAFSLEQPDRGSHTVTAEIRDRDGRGLCAASTTFHVQRPSLNSPARAAPPRPNPPRPTPHRP